MDWSAVSGVATAATGLVAIGTLLFAARDSRERSRPVVMVEYRIPRYGARSLEFVVRNAGASAARNVVVRFDPPLQPPGIETALRRFVIERYSSPIPILAPSQELTNVVIADEASPDKSDLPFDLTVHVAYDRWWLFRYRESYRLVTSVYTKHTYSRSDNAPEQRLKKIAEQIALLTNEVKVLVAVISRDSKES